MKISLDWISDYVDLSGLDIDLIANRLTLSTAEVEDVKQIRRKVSNVYVGEITSVERLDAVHNFCNVNCGGKSYTTVCGASNVKVGLKSFFAPAGAVLANDNRIAVTAKSGMTSQGILCSAAEIGLSAWHEIIFEIPNNISNGTPISELIPETDTLIEIDNKSLTHRPDLWGHYGFAREFSVIFKRELKSLPQIDLAQFDNLPAYPLRNRDYENCPVYSCIEFQTCGVIPSPIYMQRRLHALGLRSYNLLVDVTNYVNLEIGQPTHAFDADKLGGIEIATAGESIKFTTLDNQTRKLLAEDLLIWGKGNIQTSDNYRPVALAGIMGGAETEVTETTTKILLETANFKAARIRRTSNRLDLRTDASQRYEKTQPQANVKTAAARILKLINDSVSDSQLRVLSKFTVDGSLQENIREIILPKGRLELLSGIKIPQEQVLDILHSLGFNAAYNSEQSLIVGVPPFRSAKDISIQEDIVEEILRIYGYDNIPPIMPSQPIRPLFVEKQIKIEHKIQKLLSTAHRFLEVHNYIWFNDTWLKTIGFDSGETLELKNPTSPETSKLRTTLIPNLLALVPKNRPFRDAFNLFEIGRVFFPTGKNNECNEKRHLAGVAFKQSVNSNSIEEFYLMIKSAVEDIFSVCGVSGMQFVESNESDTNNKSDKSDKSDANNNVGVSVPVWYSSDSGVRICVGDCVVGSLGILNKKMISKVSPEGGSVVWFEIELDKIEGELFPEIKFVEPSRYPVSWQDFSIVWEVDRGFGQLEILLDQFTDPLIVKREFLVSYKGKGLNKGMASYSFRFWIGTADHTLSGDEINAFHKHFLKFLEDKKISLR
ncbi:MAG: phenylalanine--tRNA ligase subunit beta [Planctomycetaceae bacterium]|jgi:phenylalanyl-tRNA synthetase beta chain|nr:phenylalanine--tRNA ligase subunit beta [Planctomycetaceae bacterium]